MYVNYEFSGHLPISTHSSPRPPLPTVQLEQTLEVPNSFQI